MRSKCIPYSPYFGRMWKQKLGEICQLQKHFISEDRSLINLQIIINSTWRISSCIFSSIPFIRGKLVCGDGESFQWELSNGSRWTRVSSLFFDPSFCFRAISPKRQRFWGLVSTKEDTCAIGKIFVSGSPFVGCILRSRMAQFKMMFFLSNWARIFRSSSTLGRSVWWQDVWRGCSGRLGFVEYLWKEFFELRGN